MNLENELCTAEKQGSFWFRGHIYPSLPADAQFIMRDEISHPPFVREGARKEALRQNLVLLLQGFSKENSLI